MNKSEFFQRIYLSGVQCSAQTTMPVYFTMFNGVLMGEHHFSKGTLNKRTQEKKEFFFRILLHLVYFVSFYVFHSSNISVTASWFTPLKSTMNAFSLNEWKQKAMEIIIWYTEFIWFLFFSMYGFLLQVEYRFIEHTIAWRKTYSYTYNNNNQKMRYIHKICQF